MTRLHVNIDHIATLRQARGTDYPDPVFGVGIATRAGADGITIHLREDRRHITDRDVALIKQVTPTILNLEMAATDEIVEIACSTGPDLCTLVPERRQERTTEGGLSVADDLERMTSVVATLKAAGIRVSLFIDPVEREIEASKKTGADMVELHTGEYAGHKFGATRDRALEKLARAAAFSAGMGLGVAAGHGLHYHNVTPVARIPQVAELNIGHAIIARAVFVGLEEAIRQMRTAMETL